LIPTDESGAVDLDKLRMVVIQNRGKTGGLICSSPSYKTGKIDPVGVFADIAAFEEIALHVDCCLGGFVGEHVYHQKYLGIEGVTSLSADTHKNGEAPKGSSVLITNEMPNGENLFFYIPYANPEWSGGIYGTPNDAGSEPCTHLLQAFLAMLFFGKEGYKLRAERMCSTALEMAKMIEKTKKLTLLGEPDLHVVAFKINPELEWREGAIYELADQMKTRGFTFNALLDEALHFCITDRFATDPQTLKNFKTALKASLKEVESKNNRGEAFPKARMYCSMRVALSPDSVDQSWGDYIVNTLFGTKAVNEVVKRFYCTQINPNAPWKKS